MTSRSGHMMSTIGANGTVYIEDHGFSIMPTTFGGKTPLQDWAHRDKTPVTVEEWDRWCERGAETKYGSVVSPFNLGIITGPGSNLVVIDCDSSESAEECYKAGLWSPVRVKTKRGVHLYFRHPGQKVKTTSNCFKFIGVDIRGDGGYVVAPPSCFIDETGLYAWEVDSGHDLSDIPELPDLSPFLKNEAGAELDDGSIDLTNLRPLGKSKSFWDVTRERVAEEGKLKAGMGNYRKKMITKIAGELIAKGESGDRLIELTLQFQDEMFEDLLEVEEIKKTVRSIQASDRRKNPGKYSLDGQPITKKSSKTTTLVRKQAGNFMIRLNAPVVESKPDECIAHPLVFSPKVIQVHGHSGSGKSLVLFHLLHNVAAGQDWGPFKTLKKSKVLYVDYDMGFNQLVGRSAVVQKMYGKSEITVAHAGSSLTGMLLNSEEGQAEFLAIVEAEKPDVIVIDSIREAWPGLDETSSWAWAPINQLFKHLRDTLGKTVIFVHHSNKPGERTLGREAGSTAQLNVMDMQLHVIQAIGLDQNDMSLNPDEAISKESEVNQKAFSKGLLRDDFVYTKVTAMAAGRGMKLRMAVVLEYGKNRDGVSDMGRKMIGFCEDIHTGQQGVVSELGAMQMASTLVNGVIRKTTAEIAEESGLPVSDIRNYLKKDG